VKIIVGLGNPGKKYAGTRHNAGFMVVDYLAEKLGVRLRRSIRFSARVGRSEKSGGLVMMEPLTYMNNSGMAVKRVIRQRKAGVGDLVVVFDDADLPVGRLKVSARGSSGGHRGLQSVIDVMGSDGFPRVRVGIGRDDGDELVDRVLSPFSSAESRIMGAVIESAAEAVECVVDSGVDEAMNRFNGKAVG